MESGNRYPGLPQILAVSVLQGARTRYFSLLVQGELACRVVRWMMYSSRDPVKQPT